MSKLLDTLALLPESSDEASLHTNAEAERRAHAQQQCVNAWRNAPARVDTLVPFEVSWWSQGTCWRHDTNWFPGPLWRLDTRDDYEAFVAVLMAQDEEHARTLVREHCTPYVVAEWRWALEYPANWDPFATRPSCSRAPWPWPFKVTATETSDLGVMLAMLRRAGISFNETAGSFTDHTPGVRLRIGGTDFPAEMFFTADGRLRAVGGSES